MTVKENDEIIHSKITTGLEMSLRIRGGEGGEKLTNSDLGTKQNESKIKHKQR